MPGPQSPDNRHSSAPATPPPHRPAAASNDDDDERDEAVGDESTPFLPPSDEAPTSSPSSSFPRATRLLTASALTVAGLTVASLFATAVARQVGPVSFNLPWRTKDGLNGVVAPAIISLLVSAFNLRRLTTRRRDDDKPPPPAPTGGGGRLAFNLVVDVLIAFFAVTYGAGGLADLLLDGQGGGWCSYPGGGDDYYRICRRGALAVKVCAGVVCGALHFLLFCVRCRVAYTSGLGRFPWRLPVGQLKVEVSVKVLGDPERERGEGGG